MSNDVMAWAETGQDVGLMVITGPDGRQVVIMNREHPGRGYLWVQEHRLMSAYGLTEAPAEIDPASAFRLLGMLARKSQS